jgi:eukaryotic-like serine/threonine-protein kinase
VDGLSKKMRERIGESLRTIRRSEALAQVTTASLPALRKYTQAVHALEVDSDADRGIALLEEAIRIDSAFAMAWRKLGVTLGNRFESQERRLDAVMRAWNHRDRLTERERYMTEGTYYTMMGDTRAAIRTYESLLAESPDDYQALNNLALAYGRLHDFVRAEEVMRRAVDADSNSSMQYSNLAEFQVLLGNYDEAESTLKTGIRRLSAAYFAGVLADLALARGDYDRADSLIRAELDERKTDLRFQAAQHALLARTAALRGRLAESERQSVEVDRLKVELKRPSRVIGESLDRALVDVRIARDTARARRRIDAVLARGLMNELPALERPYLGLAIALAATGQASPARLQLEEYERLVDQRLQDKDYVVAVRAAIAITENRPLDAITESGSSDGGSCQACAALDLAVAYDAAAQPDSAIAAYERYLAVHDMYRIYTDFTDLGPALERLGELYEAKGDMRSAARLYAEFLELWSNADPVLQPRVADIRRRLTRITAEGG